MAKLDLFTYQISPIRAPRQLDIFNAPFDYDNLIKEKNAIFSSLFNEIAFFYKSKILNYKIEYNEGYFIIIRLANKRTLKREKNFHTEHLDSEPSCLIIFYNDPEQQKIVIESDKTSFRNSFVVLKIIESAINKALKEYNLKFYVNPIYEQQVVWDLFKTYEGRIETLEFEFAKPNLSRVNNMVSEELKSVSKAINSAKTTVGFIAPEDQVLENLNDENPHLVPLVTASAEGSGPIKARIKGLKRKITTAKTVKSFEIEEIEIEADDKESIRNFIEIIKGEIST